MRIPKSLALTGIALLAAVVVYRHANEPPVVLQAADVSDLLANSAFQGAAGTVPDGWVLDPKLADRGRVMVEEPAPGLRALKLEPNERNNRKEQPFALSQLIPAAQVRGRKLIVRTSMRTEGGAAAFTLAFVLHKGKVVGSAALTQTDSTPNFVPQEHDL